MEKDALAVGDSTTLEIIFSTGSYSNQVSKAPSILTNEAQGAKNVTIKANIVTKPDSTYPIVIQPPKIEFASRRQHRNDGVYDHEQVGRSANSENC